MSFQLSSFAATCIRLDSLIFPSTRSIGGRLQFTSLVKFLSVLIHYLLILEDTWKLWCRIKWFYWVSLKMHHFAREYLIERCESWSFHEVLNIILFYLKVFFLQNSLCKRFQVNQCRSHLIAIHTGQELHNVFCVFLLGICNGFNSLIGIIIFWSMHAVLNVHVRQNGSITLPQGFF